MVWRNNKGRRRITWAAAAGSRWCPEHALWPTIGRDCRSEADLVRSFGVRRWMDCGHVRFM
eukprot:5367723-Prymnesium_polylepis.1